MTIAGWYFAPLLDTTNIRNISGISKFQGAFLESPSSPRNGLLQHVSAKVKGVNAIK